MASTPAVRAVARVAHLASDALTYSRSPRQESDDLTVVFDDLAVAHPGHAALSILSFGADPTPTLLRREKPRLLSYLAYSHPQILNQLLVHLVDLSETPLVLHVAVEHDLSDALVLQSTLPFCVYSRTAQQAHDHALLASRLATVESKAVLHIFHVGQSTDEVSELAQDAIHSHLLAPKPAVNGHANGHANGVNDNANRVNGHANGVNGNANGVNGSANGVNGNAKPSDSSPLFKAYEAVAVATAVLLHRPVRPFTLRGIDGAHTALVTLGPATLPEIDSVAYIDVSLVKPLPAASILGAGRRAAPCVIVVEQLSHWHMKWTPLYLALVGAAQELPAETRPTVHSCTLAPVGEVHPTEVLKLLEKGWSAPATARFSLGTSETKAVKVPEPPHVPKHEASYTKILNYLFGERLEISNSPELVQTLGQAATLPEFTLGRVRGELEQRDELVAAVRELLQHPDVPLELHTLLSSWVLARDDGKKSAPLGEAILQALDTADISHPAAQKIRELKEHLPARSRWIIGSDAWAYDLGASGLHHTIASRLNVNVLVLDTLPYSTRNTPDAARRKQDVGLYAMNHGDVYVASVAVYSSYSQVLQAMMEADRFDGPSVVLAYLPYKTEDAPALEILKETKLAVDAGYWPLYRWNPAKERDGKDPFTLDSDAIKNDLQRFLDRQNHLSQLVRSTPQLATELVGSLGENLRQARRNKAQQAYSSLLTAIDAPPLLVLYASDGGRAEKVAKRLALRGKMRGLSTTVATMDSVSVEDVAKEEFVAFVTSVAGQGEFPQNGRTFAKALNVLVAQGEKPLTSVRYSVFSLGDSHYWPRPEDAHFYNKSGKDLDSRLAQLGAQPFAAIGLGDDQDADGPETGYKAWEPLVWKALGVDSIEVQEQEPEPITNEHIKVASQYLRGTITEGLNDFSTGALAPSDTQLTKFHGIYQQDDRDIRDERQAQGVEPAYSFMIRVRMPGGVCRPDQWLLMDQLADEHGNGTFKITTRQTFQFHGVIKRHLKPAIQNINRALLDTLAACGDVNRNVIVSAVPSLSKLHQQVYEFSKNVSIHLLPRTTAYHEIWLDKKLVAGEALKDAEPLYGEFYLPRKYKIAVAVPPTNDVDLFANDVGFIAIVDEKGDLAGFNVTAGGGMGVTHGNKKTYPRIGDVLGFCTIEQGHLVAEKIMIVQRDNGNREDRKNARLKYTIDRMGLDVFKAEVEKLLGWKLAPARPFTFDRNIDDFGWHTGENGKHHFTCFIENGRVQDETGKEFKKCLREIAKIHKGAFRMTANQHLVISDIEPADLPVIKELLAQYKLDNLSHSALRLSSSACVAFPTCGLAMAESERYLPLLIDKVEKICEENGLRNDSIVMRMTGCPNGCARPYLGEVAFVGKAPGTYLMLLGGGYHGQRLNKIYRETVTEPEILDILRPMIKHYALERQPSEHFGDFVIRAGYIARTTSGKAWYESMGGEGIHREVAASA